MILYHGSNVDIQNISLSACRPYKDFGKGFYLGEIPSNTLTTGEINYTITNRAKLLPPVVEPLSTILYNSLGLSTNLYIS